MVFPFAPAGRTRGRELVVSGTTPARHDAEAVGDLLALRLDALLLVGVVLRSSTGSSPGRS